MKEWVAMSTTHTAEADHATLLPDSARGKSFSLCHQLDLNVQKYILSLYRRNFWESVALLNLLSVVLLCVVASVASAATLKVAAPMRASGLILVRIWPLTIEEGICQS